MVGKILVASVAATLALSAAGSRAGAVRSRARFEASHGKSTVITPVVFTDREAITQLQCKPGFMTPAGVTSDYDPLGSGRGSCMDLRQPHHLRF